MADDIVVGSVAVDIVPDTRKTASQLKAKLQGLSVDVGVNADTTGIRAELDDLTRKRDATIVANAEVAEANSQLDIAARDRTSTIRANVDKSQVGAVGSLSKSLGNISVLGTSIIALGPALIPILGTVAAIGVALGAPLAIAGAGATVFGFLAGFAVKDTNAQLKAIDKAAAHLATLKKGTADYAAAQADLKAKQDALSPAQKKFAAALDHIKGTFATLLGGKVGNQLLGPVSAFLTLAADVLPRLTPIIGSVSDALSDLLGDLGKAVKGPEFKSFIDTFTRQVGPDIQAFGHIAGNVFRGVSGLILKLGDAFGPGLLKGIESLTDKFGNLAGSADKSKALQGFVDYFHRVGPQVGATIGAVARAVGHVVEALAPLGPPALKVVEGIANAISAIPVPVLTALAGAFVAMTAAAKISKGLNSLGVLKSGLTGGGGGLLGGLASSAKPIPVFVVNEGFGGAGGAGGKTGPTGLLGKAGLIGALFAGSTALSLGSDAVLKKEYGKFTGGIFDNVLNSLTGLPNPTAVKMQTKFYSALFAQGPGAAFDLLKSKTNVTRTVLPLQTPQSIQAGIDLRRADIPEIRSTTTKVDALRSSLNKASAGFDLVGHSAHRNFESITTDAAALKAKLDAIKDKDIRVILQAQAAIQSMKALQAFRFKDKTIDINERERVVGPGGGIGHPLPAAPRADTHTPNTRSGSSGSAGPLVNIQNAHIADTNDLLRKSQDALIARAGGGVMLRPPPTARFS